MIKQLMNFLAKIFGLASGLNGNGQVANNDSSEFLDQYEELMMFIESERDKQLERGEYQKAYILETQRLGLETTINQIKDPNTQSLSPKEQAEKAADMINEAVKDYHDPKMPNGHKSDYLAKNPKTGLEALNEMQELVSHKVNSMKLGAHESPIRGLMSTLGMGGYEAMTARPETPAQKAGLAPSDEEIALQQSKEDAMEKKRELSSDKDSSPSPSPTFGE